MKNGDGSKVSAEQVQRVRLEMKASDMILDLVRQAKAGELDDVPNGDVQGICEALAMGIIKEVKRVI
jgi:hypothetical protein